MPIPKPKPDETQDEFGSRCMSDSSMQKDYPDQDQRYAVCMDSWRNTKGTNSLQVSDEQLRTRGSAKQRKRVRMLHEQFKVKVKTASFKWIPTIKQKLSKGERLYRIVAIRTGDTYHIDRNKRHYSRKWTEEELKRSVRTLIGGHIDENHFWWMPFENCEIVDAEFESDRAECLVYTDNEYVDKLYDMNRIKGVSVEYNVRSETKLNGYRQEGVVFFGLGLITGVAKPACRTTSIDLLVKGEKSTTTRMCSSIQDVRNLIRGFKYKTKTKFEKQTEKEKSEKIMPEKLEVEEQMNEILVKIQKNLIDVETQVKANTVAIKTLQEPDVDECPEGQHKDDEGKCVPDKTESIITLKIGDEANEVIKGLTEALNAFGITELEDLKTDKHAVKVARVTSEGKGVGISTPPEDFTGSESESKVSEDLKKEWQKRKEIAKEFGE